MRQKLFCDNWMFLKTSTECTPEEALNRKEEFRAVNLPHDWLIGNAKDLYENGTGWYLRRLAFKELKESSLHYRDGEKVFLRFDGVYMDSRVFVNGKQVYEWKYGYSAFDFEITDFLTEEENEILVQVIHMSPNSRWYSGAGIYRDVMLRVCGLSYLPYDGTYVSYQAEEDGSFLVHMETEVAAACAEGLEVTYAFAKDGVTAYGPYTCSREQWQKKTEAGRELWLAVSDERIKMPLLWDVESPNRYTLQVCLTGQGEVLDQDILTVGFKKTEFDENRGFFLNGRHLKLQGVCEHHDLGCLGSAFHLDALKRKFTILKKMGVNAVRTSHNMPARQFMDLADEMGLLVLSEAFDMWELPKTTYDYARFFPEYADRDVRSWIRRDRNHPSLLLWSIGNEIYDTHAGERGYELTGELMDKVRRHDPYENAKITLGSNYMPWENTQKCAGLYKIAGYNYGARYYREHHQKYPDFVIYGSETASIVMSRGVYHFPYSMPVLSELDEQCSALGNSTTSWGAKSVESCIAEDRDVPFSLGQFLWSGFDYIGEPTPYHTKNSYFGQIDTAGFPKDSYYVYQAEWTDAEKNPMVHLFPYWDFNEGQLIDVRACSNGSAVELFVNGVSRGRQILHHDGGTDFTAWWQVPYEAGWIEAVAYREDGSVLAREKRYSFGDSAAIMLQADRMELDADGESLCFVEISTVDAEGHPVENAMDYVRVEVEGGAYLLGLDNGDSTDYESYQSNRRKLFNGKLLAVIQAGEKAGNATVRVSAEGLKRAELKLILQEASPVEGHGTEAVRRAEKEERQMHAAKEEMRIPARKIALSCAGSRALTGNCRKAGITAALLPENTTDRKLIFQAVNPAGIEINYVDIRPGMQEDQIEIEARGDGDFLLRALSADQEGKIHLLSQLEFTAQGIGEAYLDPYTLVMGGLYTKAYGDIGTGNEKGFSSARAEDSGVCFEKIDFGEIGSDEITLPIFTLSEDAYPFQIYEGEPESGNLLLDTFYQKPSIWNVYQEETYRLPKRLKGICSLSFVFHDKIHVKGFYFKKYEKAYEKLPAASCSRVYGDSFRKEEERITGIGNNVTLEFEDMDFGRKGTGGIRIWGRSSLKTNTIHIQFRHEDGTEETQIVEVQGQKEYTEQYFPLTAVSGMCRVSFVFLPGSSFDFEAFCFEEAK